MLWLRGFERAARQWSRLSPRDSVARIGRLKCLSVGGRWPMPPHDGFQIRPSRKTSGSSRYWA